MVTTSPTPTKGRKAKAPAASAPVETPAADAAASTSTIPTTKRPQPAETAVARMAQPEPETAPVVVEGASPDGEGSAPDLAPAAETGKIPEAVAAPVSGVELSQPKRRTFSGLAVRNNDGLAGVIVDGEPVDVLAYSGGIHSPVLVIVTVDGRKFRVNAEDYTATDTTTGEELEVV